MIKICARCGAEFNALKGTKYCSQACRREAALEHKRASYERLKKPTSSMDERFKPVELICQTCGAKFTGVFNRKYCSEKCRRAAQRELESLRRRNRRRNVKADPATKKPVKSLEDWIREARECNLDYSTYRTLVELCGMTFDELKAERRRVQTHSHCKAFRKMA